MHQRHVGLMPRTRAVLVCQNQEEKRAAPTGFEQEVEGWEQEVEGWDLS